MTVTAIAALLAQLEAEGVDHIFGVPGGPLTALFQALRQRNRIRFVLAKHEEGAAFMANSYARVRRGLAVCAVTSGPGATNALTGIAGAFADSLPVLLVTGQVATKMFGKGAIQESSVFGVDVVEIFRPITKLSALVPSGERMQELVAHAVRCALSGRRGPVHLSVPADVAKQPVELEDGAPRRVRAMAVEPTDLIAIERAADALARARRPTILAGHGVAVASAEPELLAVAEAAGAAVATSPKGKGVFPEDHELSAGVFGLGGHALADRCFADDDVILVVGTSLNEFASAAWDPRLRPSDTAIQIDIDPVQIGRNYPIDIPVVGHARSSLAALAAALAARGVDRSRAWIHELRADTPRWEDDPGSEPDAGPLPARRVVRELRAALPHDGLVFVDAGNSIMWGGHYFEARQPNTYFIDLGIACMGSAVAGAVGGAIAAPGRAVAVLAGDAAFMMHGTEVHTAVELGLRIVWVVLDNCGHGMVTHGERMIFGQDLGFGTWRNRVDAAAMARALGARGERVETAVELRRALAEAFAAPEPTVIDVVIDATIRPPTLARRAEALAEFFGAKRDR